jgi:hypothetical protein
MSSLKESLAARLRQSVQGCSIHSHGPIQAWAAIQQASEEDQVDIHEVAKIAMEACTHRIAELRATGVRDEDPRLKKEELTRAFIERLLR